MNKKHHSCKGHFLKGGKLNNLNLAYPSSNVPSAHNPYLAYTGKGGSNMSVIHNEKLHDPDINGFVNPITSQLHKAMNFINPSSSQKGGCGCGLVGGSSGYPNGLVGEPTNPGNLNTLPGVDGVSGNRNYLEYNTYKADPQTAMINTSAQPPFSVGGKKSKSRRMHKGGSYPSFSLIPQDLVNLTRNTLHSVNSGYHTLNGTSAPVNPRPFMGQIPTQTNLTTIQHMK